MKKILFVMLAMVFAVSLTAGQLDVVKQLLPDAGDKAQVLKLSEADVAKVQEALGSKAPVKAEYELYVSKTGVVVIDEQMGKWAPIVTAILIDPKTKEVTSVVIISMNEKRGGPVKSAVFLNQFKGKSSAKVFDVGKGVKGVTGATISSKAVTISVRRALVIYDLYLAGTKK